MTYIRNRKHTRTTRAAYLHSTIAASAIALSVQTATAAETEPAEQRLPQVEVSSQRNDGFKADSVSSPKYTRPLLDTPQTISVIRQELVRQQNATTLSEALRNTPGVGTFNLGENGASQSGDAIYMRGVSSASSIFVDGIRDTGAVTRDMFNLEQVEVFKGAAAADSGRGSAAGYVNAQSKSAGMEAATGVSASYGSGSQKRVTLDLNRPLDVDTGTAFRLNLVQQNSGVPGRRNVRDKRWGVAPTMSWGLGTPTRLQLSFVHVEQDNVPDGGVPTIGLRGFHAASAAARAAPAVDSANFYGLNSDYNRVRSDMFTVRVDHELRDGLSVHNISRFGSTTQHQVVAVPFFSDDPRFPNSLNASSPNRANWTVERIRQAKDIDNEIWTNQTSVKATFGSGPLKHTVVAGLELSREQQRNWAYDGIGRNQLAPANLYAPDPADPPLTTLKRNGGYTQGATDTIAPYLSHTMDLGPQWQLSSGVRLDRYSTGFDTVAPGAATTHASTSGNLLNWKLAVNYKPAANGSIYAAWATSQQPPGGASFTLNATNAGSADNPRFAPQQTRTVELGSKWEVLERRLALSGALFRSDITNEIRTDATDNSVFVQTGAKRAQGVELAASGNITPAWALNAGLALVDTKVTQGDGAQQGAQLNWSPRVSLSAWSSYQFNHAVLVGAGARYVDSMVRSLNNAPGATANMASVPSYWVFDAMASYAMTPNVSLQLNLYNLANRKYVAALNNSGARYLPGTPRSAVLSLNLKY